MALQSPNQRFEMVDCVEVRIGNEYVKHHFGRRITMDHARKWALHYVDAFTGVPTGDQS